MSELQELVDTRISALSERLCGYLDGNLTDREMASVAWSIIDAWAALPASTRASDAVPHDDILWYAVWTIQHLADPEHRSDGLTNPALHECLHLLERRSPLPPHYSARRP